MKSNQEEHHIMIERSNDQEQVVAIVNTYVHNIGAPTFIQKIFKDLKEETYCNILIQGTSLFHTE